jgi:hypothetical protein
MCTGTSSSWSRGLTASTRMKLLAQRVMAEKQFLSVAAVSWAAWATVGRSDP